MLPLYISRIPERSVFGFGPLIHRIGFKPYPPYAVSVLSAVSLPNLSLFS
ncbi:MAG: hypothetical protein AVDCRST_MAG56-3680 [uncultured Cytophagales bacterium]|uniref:Uncharacterized protein n=1 Tax=uncultured Cytophagales bacterium TaxID=158755 RepID=A0A6J4JKE5_9SPHI|nr:MAG: hypothetical protein AVDCRST_MAG56-3680 [uncultured Cytophagales bacterium]